MKSLYLELGVIFFVIGTSLVTTNIAFYFVFIIPNWNPLFLGIGLIISSILFFKLSQSRRGN